MVRRYRDKLLREVADMPGLFDPINIRGLALKNRLVMPPMATGMATEDGEVTLTCRLLDCDYRSNPASLDIDLPSSLR